MARKFNTIFAAANGASALQYDQRANCMVTKEDIEEAYTSLVANMRGKEIEAGQADTLVATYDARRVHEEATCGGVAKGTEAYKRAKEALERDLQEYTA